MTPSNKDNILLTSAVDRMGELVADGAHPTDALVKTAEELGLLPGFMDVTAKIFNSGLQVDQFERGKTASDKLASMPLADCDAAVKRIYGKKETPKPAGTVTKVAGDAFDALPVFDPHAHQDVDLFYRKTAEDAPPPKPSPILAAFKKLAAEREGLEQLNVDIQSSRDSAMAAMNKVAGYFKTPSQSRLSLAEVEAVAKHAFDDFDLDNLFDYVAERHPQEKRASADQIVSGRVKLSLPPFNWIQELVTDCNFLKEATEQVEQFNFRILDLEKQAGIGDVGSITLGTALGQSVMGQPHDEDQVKSIYGDLNDPQHISGLNGIRTKAVLSHVINDPDDPITGVPLDKIVHKYNDIAAIAPHLARTPTTLKPILRRLLQSAPQPFELQEIAGLERAINPNNAPRPKDGE